MNVYHSSSDVQRTFCGKCSATVFYWCDDRPELIDLAVGILRAEDGAMARQWLEWKWGKVVWKEEATEQAILKEVLVMGDSKGANQK